MLNKRFIVMPSFYITIIAIFLLLLSSHATAMPKGGSTQQGNTVTGTILEAMDSGGYTYMNVDTGKEKVWVAIPASKVKKGDKVTYMQGMVMPNFQSKTLNRTFETIVFSAGLAGKGMANPHKGMKNSLKGKKTSGDSFADAVKAESGPAATMSPPPEKQSGGSAGAVAPFMETKVTKAEGKNGYTVEEIFTKSKDLNGKTVRVKGKIVKYNPNIMGKNWIHLQDGTGDPMKNTHDLVVTTTEQLSSEDVITIEGTMVANKDFGAGYRYDAIIEKAKIIK